MARKQTLTREIFTGKLNCIAVYNLECTLPECLQDKCHFFSKLNYILLGY